jgi:enamine deaminase RidA (YjgF/YER057c/UK114 family)
MSLQRLNPPQIFEHPNFTRMIVVDPPAKMVWISGQTPQNDDLSCVAPGNYQAQYIDVMEKLEIQLKVVGASWDDVVFRRTYTKSIAQLRAAMALPSTPPFFGDKKPCSTLLGITELSDPDFLLEIEVLVVMAAS